MEPPLTDATVLPLLLLLAGPLAGSFLGVLADRLPRGESVVHPRSACRSCGAVLAPRDLVPVLSYALGRGRCRHCGAHIPPWLLYIEIAATGLAALVVIAGGPPVQMVLGAVLMWLLLALAVADLIWFRLPDSLTAALAVTALTLATFEGTLAAALVGAGIGSGAFWLLRTGYRKLRGREGLGLGDVKLMVGLGAMTGPWNLPLMVLLAALAALAGAMAERLVASPGALRATRPLPFGAALCAATAALWLAGRLPG